MYNKMNVLFYNCVQIQDVSVNGMPMRRKGTEEGEGTAVTSLINVQSTVIILMESSKFT